MLNTILLAFISLAVLLLLWLAYRQSRHDASRLLLQQLEEKHRDMLRDFNDGLNKLGDRLNQTSGGQSELLRAAVAQELQQTRDAMQSL